ncbi:MAG: LysR family transcriptional regulator [Polaromonas sp.]
MNINTFDLNLLRVFTAVHELRNVSRAAIAIGLSQPAMSNALQRLRRICDDPLFVRTRGGMEPTALAASLADPVRQALDILQNCLSNPAGFDPARSDRLFRLLMSDVGEVIVLPKLMDALQRTAPAVRIEALQSPHENYPAALESGQADLAIGNLTTLRGGFYQQLLFSDSYICIARKNHPLIGKQLTLKDYLMLSHVVTTAGSAESMVEKALARRQHRIVRLKVTHYHVAATIVANTDLVATVPENAALGLKNLQIFELPIRVTQAQVRQFWHRRAHGDPANQWLRAFIANLPLCVDADRKLTHL